METYEYWKKKWDNPDERPLFGTDPNYPTEIDDEWVVWIYTSLENSVYGKWEKRTYHRIDGPAVIWINGNVEWMINNNSVALKRNNIGWQGEFYDWTVEQGMDIDNLTDEDKTLIKLVWS